MVTSLFLAYLEEIPRLNAERLLDVASASHPTADWFDAQIAVLRERQDQSSVPLDAGPTPFRLKLADPQGTGNFSGRVSPRALHARISLLQDGGYG